MNSYLMQELARTTVEQRRGEAAAHHRAKLARQAARATRFVARVTNRPRVPAQRTPEHRPQVATVGGGPVRG